MREGQPLDSAARPHGQAGSPTVQPAGPGHSGTASAQHGGHMCPGAPDVWLGQLKEKLNVT